MNEWQEYVAFFNVWKLFLFIHHHCCACGFPLAIVQGAYTLADDVKALIRVVYARLGRLTLGIKRGVWHQDYTTNRCEKVSLRCSFRPCFPLAADFTLFIFLPTLAVTRDVEYFSVLRRRTRRRRKKKVSFFSKSLRIPTTRDFELICNLFGYCDREEVATHNFGCCFMRDRKRITKPFRFQSWQNCAGPSNIIQLYNHPSCISWNHEADNVLYYLCWHMVCSVP